MSELERRVAHWVREEIRNTSAYNVPDPGNLIKLDAMENPYHWPETMVQEWLERLRSIPLNRYPDPGARMLSERLREVLGIPDKMAMILGNGSDEIIQIMALALSGPQRVVLAPEPGFAMYRVIAACAGMSYVGVPLKEDFSLAMDAMLEAIQRHDPALIFLAYPNNPTGNLFSDADIQTIVQEASGLVVVDEAYHAFSLRSWMESLGEYTNLVVMRTLSKLGLAGLRLGLLVGPEEWLAEFDKVRLPYNINVLTQASAEFALERMHVLDQQAAEIRKERSRLYAALSEMEGITPYPSVANFILFRVPQGRATELFTGCREQGILIKDMGATCGPLADCLRVTVGRAEENAAFLHMLSHLRLNR